MKHFAMCFLQQHTVGKQLHTMPGFVQLVSLQYISAVCKVLHMEVAGLNAVLPNGITFRHILIAAVCGHGHGHVRHYYIGQL